MIDNEQLNQEANISIMAPVLLLGCKVQTKIISCCGKLPILYGVHKCLECKKQTRDGGTTATFFYFPAKDILFCQKYQLGSFNNSYIWCMPLQLSCGNISKIWIMSNRLQYFDSLEKLQK